MREKIILIIVALVAAGGLLSIATDIRKSKERDEDPVSAAGKLGSFIQSTQASLMAAPLTDEHKYVLTRANAEWPGSPFIEERAMLKAAREVARQFSYSGFLAIEEKEFAIINGLEYQEGDAVEPGGYIVHRIAADAVILRGKQDGVEVKVTVDEQTLK